MKMHEVMERTHRRESKHPYTLTLTLDHRQADQFCRLARNHADVTVVQIDDIRNEKAVVSAACVSAEVRDRLADAW